MQLKKTDSLKKYGINFNLLNQTYNLIGLNKKKTIIKLKLIKKNIFTKISNIFTYNDTLKLKIEKQISYFKDIKSYTGTRHLYKYPVRGQRTHTNAKTQKRLKII